MANSHGKILPSDINVLRKTYASMRLATASGRSRIWLISRSGFSSVIGTSV